MSADRVFARTDEPLAPGMTLAAMNKREALDAERPTTPIRRPAALSDENRQTREQLMAIHDELTRLRALREQLEQRRRQLLAASIAPRPSAGSRCNSANGWLHGPTPRLSRSQNHSDAHSQTRLPSPIALSRTGYMHPTSSSRMHLGGRPFSARESSCGGSSVRHRQGRAASPNYCTALKFADTIPSEQARRDDLRETPHLVMKKAMRRSADSDSMLVIGDFLLEDNSKVYTFGRERRFMPLVRQRGNYCLATDTALAQDAVRQAKATNIRTAAAPIDATPGPGAYTPRFNKVSKPSALASMHY